MFISYVTGSLHVPAIAFLAGLFTLITPAVIFSTLWMIVYTSKLQESEKDSFALASKIIILTLVLKNVIIFNILDPSTPLVQQDFAKTFKYLILLFTLIVGVWLLNGFNNSRIKIESEVFFRWLILFIISFQFFLVSMSSSGPLFGTMITTFAYAEDWPYSAIASTLFFSLGLLLPLFFIIYLTSRWFKKIGKKNWIKVVQIIAGIYLTGSSFVRMLLEL
jgi:cytochrome c biogenesis protein CcdA